MTAYPDLLLFSLAISSVSVALSVVNAILRAGRLARERTLGRAMSLLTAVGLVVISLGLSVSALGWVYADQGLANTGLASARGALLVLVLTLVAVEFVERRD